MSKNMIIAIDGPAGSGKSTSAKLVAQKLNYLYIDTGAMYRAITYLAMRRECLNEIEKVIEIAEKTNITLKFENGITLVFADGEDVTEAIRSINVNKNVSFVSKIKEVRAALVKKQQEMGQVTGGVVMEGRDIGTVVFPDADIKIFLTATIDRRAERRAKEYEAGGTHVSFDEVKNNLLNRDIIDSSRKESPLKQAEDATVVDTSKVSIAEQVELILDIVKKKNKTK
ncbi:MAG: (d)CMP kinase [Ignavibacteriaceae bacterium]|nr:(d)CMP kinase [Ignavibacteriaceae bacterium]